MLETLYTMQISFVIPLLHNSYFFSNLDFLIESYTENIKKHTGGFN